MAIPSGLSAVLNWLMTPFRLKKLSASPDGLSTLHLLSHDSAIDTVIYEERIRVPEAAASADIVMAPKTTTAQLWLSMTGGETE